ncbi:MarR family transcriptional regulator [Sulfitobacter sp. SK012]|uniref:MarR family winged helix-turn-helix transcriptional regulator n=1 Tax=Sulfitobacter sp. SK012 TaxID=1389005 RepID=UPI000E0A5007|nr:MarR family transcriptional regulator [Sulfitobacter sp. SK012]AXI47104.1 MarR family transcriptional regulator [Sulfitobacter sp. SK012]
MTSAQHPDDPASKERLRLWLRLLKMTRSVDARLRDKFRVEFASTLPRFDLMAALSQHKDGLKMSRLSDVLRVSGGNVTGIADRLADEGLVERVPVPGDRRATLLRLTPTGYTEFASQARAHEAWIDDMLSGVTAEEARTLAARLQQFADQTDKAEETHAQ